MVVNMGIFYIGIIIRIIFFYSLLRTSKTIFQKALKANPVKVFGLHVGGLGLGSILTMHELIVPLKYK